MSGIYVLVVFGIWLLASWMIIHFWRRWQPSDQKKKILRLALGILIFSVWFGGTFWMVAGKKMYWDAKVREWCAKDGGVTVYETIELPAEMFNEWGQPNFYRPTQDENALGDGYVFVEQKKIYRMTSPHVSKRVYTVFRKADHKLLGKSVIYGRGGGDFPGPWHGSSFSCPKHPPILSLFSKIFQKSKENKE